MAAEQRSVIVTGSSRGIGRAVAERLAADGIAMTVNYADNRKAADEAVAAIVGAGGRAVAVQADISQSGDVTRLFDETEQAFGHVDALSRCRTKRFRRSHLCGSCSHFASKEVA